MAQQQNAAQLRTMLQICIECTCWCVGGCGMDKSMVIDSWLKQLGILLQKTLPHVLRLSTLFADCNMVE